MKFLIFCVLWFVIFIASFFLGKELVSGISQSNLILFSTVFSWCVAMVIILAGDLNIDVSLPKLTHQEYGYFVSHRTSFGVKEGMIVFRDKRLEFLKKYPDGILYPDFKIPYEDLQGIDYENPEGAFFIKTSNKLHHFVGDQETVQNLFNLIGTLLNRPPKDRHASMNGNQVIIK